MKLTRRGGWLVLLQLRKMQEMIAKMQAEMAKQGSSAANSSAAVPPTANGSTAATTGTVHQVWQH